ncbi:MAG: hypothetical protein GJT30_04600 [Geobacter sp.]|nr:hypothetical protein [Geobacter sp.]
MTIDGKRQSCAICAWRVNCAKRFCVQDGGARCPDYSRDVSIKEPQEPAQDQQEKQEEVRGS